MKRGLLLSILGIVASLPVTSSHAQGRIFLDSYNTYGPLITVYGVSGFPNGSGIYNTGSITWTVGFYWAAGDVRGSVGNDPSGSGEIPTWANGLALATGMGSVANPVGSFAPGTFLASDSSDFTFPGVLSGVVTMAVFVYANGPNYSAGLYRAHSTAFLMTPTQGPGFATSVGVAMPGFSIIIPEPSISALAGMGGIALLVFRRRKK